VVLRFRQEFEEIWIAQALWWERSLRSLLGWRLHAGLVSSGVSKSFENDFRVRDIEESLHLGVR
jgi:hypothetical protein